MQKQSLLYFDYAASTPVKLEVLQTLQEVALQHYANPSSLHAAGADSNALLERARLAIAKQLGTAKGEWIFTSGGTESNNLAIFGAARQYAGRGKHLITTMTEHPSVYESFARLEREGFEVTYLSPDADGLITADQVHAALRKDTILVSIMHVNNEIGTIAPIKEIAQIVQNHQQARLHVDAVQGIAKQELDIEGWGIDLVSGSAHKLGGPRGVGILYLSPRTQLQPLFAGGSQENGLRAGTPNVPAIVATAKALRLAIESMPAAKPKLAALREHLLKRIEAIPELVLTTNTSATPHIVHVTYEGMKPEVMVHMLEERGIMVSTKSACSSRDFAPSRVLLALGMHERRAASGLRISFGEDHTLAQIDALADSLERIVSRLKTIQ